MAAQTPAAVERSALILSSWRDLTRHRTVIRNDRQSSRDVPIQLGTSDGESPQQPEVLQGNPRVEVVRDGPPITYRGLRFKSGRTPTYCSWAMSRLSDLVGRPTRSVGGHTAKRSYAGCPRGRAEPRRRAETMKVPVEFPSRRWRWGSPTTAAVAANSPYLQG